MKLFSSLLMLTVFFSSVHAFAGDAENTISADEIAKTMKSMNELMEKARAKMEDGQIVGYDTAKTESPEAYEKLSAQRSLDIITHLESESDVDSN